MIVLLLFSGFFSMSETVFSSVSLVKLKTAVENRRRGSKIALSCAENFDRTLTTLLIGNNIVNTALATISVGFFTMLAVSAAYVELVSTLSITVIVLIFGEILPKTFGKTYSLSISLKLAPIVYFLSIILFPFSILFMKLQSLISNNKNKKPSVNESELGAIVDTMEEEGSIKPGEAEIIRNVFDLDDRTVEDIMIPRVDILAIDITTPLSEIEKIMLNNRFSRIPIYREDKDHVAGILYERDFFEALVRHEEPSQIDITKIMKPVKYVSKTMSVGVLIKELQKTKTHIAIVSGEYNDTLGLVTMEDALEELVGEIYDEHDDLVPEKELITKLDENNYLVDGETYLENLFDELDIGEPDENLPTKVSGFIFESTEKIPTIGYECNLECSYTKFDENSDSYVDYNTMLTFKIVDINKRRIKTVKVTLTNN